MPAPGANPGVPPPIRSGVLSSNDAFNFAPSTQVFLTPSGTVLNLTGTSAQIWWETSVAATSAVEWGVGTAGNVATADYPRCDPDFGSPCRSVYHRVTLAGLTPGATYVYRVRSSDDYRNLAEAPLGSFTTVAPAAPAPPTLVTSLDLWGSMYDPASLSTTLSWSAVVAPNGHVAQYALQLATDPGFAAGILYDTGWIATTSTAVEVTARLPSGPIAAAYFWRVKVRDPVEKIESPWSGMDGFAAWLCGPYAY
jgi:phosphodiesterase/alkaline phosphatase D-like protein